MFHHDDRSRSSRELSSCPYRSRTRSISPPRHHRRHRDDYDDDDYHHRRHRHHRDSRSRSPESSKRRRHDHHHRHDWDRHDERRRTRSETPTAAAPPVLPFNARQLSKHDLAHYEPMFAMYLDIQKGLILEDLSEEEVKGRWKSFVKRW